MIYLIYVNYIFLLYLLTIKICFCVNNQLKTSLSSRTDWNIMHDISQKI